MCGLAGEIRFDGRERRRRRRSSAMCSRLAARGPDGSGIWADGRVALGHRRLAIIDLSAAGVAADGGRRARADPGVQRLHLQLPGAAGRTAGRRLPVLLHLGHRGHRQGLRAMGSGLRRAVHGDVRVRHRRARDRPGDPGPRPPRHQAAVPGPDPRPAALRVVPAGPARRRRHRHLDRPHRAGALHELPLGRAGAAHDPQRRAQTAAGDRARRSSPTARSPTTSTGARSSPATRPARTGRPRTGRTRSSAACAPRSSGGWSPTSRSGCCCRAASIRASSSRCWPRPGRRT